ncbi:hypothetical protein, partial [Pseudarcicella hirudinis]|uniref:hypothetical protein n=1 Tax=Pseudarcicella hirudinis TaxID=1079859 RepID=UPI0036439280
RVYNLSWDPQVGAQTYEVAYKLTTASVWTTAIAYTGTFSVVKPVEGKYEFKVRSNCSLARQSEWSEIYSEPVSVAVKSNSKPAASASNTSPPQTNSSNNSSNNSNGAGNVEDPLDIIVSSQDISPAAIAQKRDELDKLETPSESRCGGSMHSTVDCNITPKVYSGTVAFVPAKGQKIYMNGYEIIVTSGDASAGEGLLYYPFVRQRIPVSWSGISIVEGEKGKDYGCITEGEVKAQGSNGTVVTNDLERQITSLLSSGPGSYSGKFGEALEAMKAKAQELLDKIARGEKPGKEDYQEYNNICKAIKSGIESIKNTTQTQNTDPKFLAKIAPILNDLDSYKDKLLAEADCEGLGYHSALREAVFYASIKSQLYPEALVSICKLGESSSLAGNILNRIEDLAVETAAAKSSIKCGCDGLMDYLTGDGNCQSVIYNLELLKRDISKNKVSHKLNNPAGGTGQVKIGEICIDNLQIKFYGDNPEINPLSKQKTREGIDFSAANSSNIVLNVNVLDKAEKDKKIEAVW